MSEKDAVANAGPAALERWGSDIRYTWLLVLVLIAAPAVIFGSTIQSAVVLMATVLFGLPTALASLLLTRDKAWRARLWRRMVVIASVASVSLAVVMKTDELTPGMAAPIANAIEQYKTDSGAYPNSLNDLIPKYLVELPAVRASIKQPKISYTVRDGRPRLAIPSAAGDGFANYEYNFETRAWRPNI